MHRWKSLAGPLLVACLITGPSLAADVRGGPTPTTASSVGEKVNINTAGVKELMTLEGVGRRVAERIVEYRQAHGPFKKPDEIRRVEGIGGGLWEKNRERIAVK
jgi:competence protein ComEA